MDNQENTRYIVESVTRAGARFRPSDWIDRISSWDATFAQHRLVYSQRLHPVLMNGQKVLAIEPALKEHNRQMYDSVMQFIKRNNLKVYLQYPDGHMEECDETNSPCSNEATDKS